MAVQLSVPGLYLPPVFNSYELSSPPQTIISLPVHTAVWLLRASGALVVLVAVQLSVPGLYLPPVFELLTHDSPSAPDDHFAAGPDCRVTDPGSWARWSCWWLSNYPVPGLYLPPVFRRLRVFIVSAPDNHFTASPYCRVNRSGRGRVGRAGGCPSISDRDCISPPVFDEFARATVVSAPDDHLAAGPDCRVRLSGIGAPVRLVGVHVSSMHAPPDIAGKGVVSASSDASDQTFGSVVSLARPPGARADAQLAWALRDTPQ